MARYEYPKLDPEWHFWPLMIKVFKALGLPPTTHGLVEGFSSNAEVVWIDIARELTATEKENLDKLMARKDAGLYVDNQVGYTVFEIQDIFDAWGELELIVGKEIEYMYCNFPYHDKLEIWIKGELTPAEKRRFIDAYACLIKEKSSG
jgi:hypothetical protein